MVRWFLGGEPYNQIFFNVNKNTELTEGSHVTSVEVDVVSIDGGIENTTRRACNRVTEKSKNHYSPSLAPAPSLSPVYCKRARICA